MSCIKLLIGLLGTSLLTMVLALDQDMPPLEETTTSGPSVHVPISAIEQIEVGGYSLPEVLRHGERIYQRSCVNCHGIWPVAFQTANQPQRFVETVRGGSGDMPGLSYKINAVEAEMVRWYLSECTRELRIC